MEHYNEDLSIREALPELFRRFGFPADAYTAKYFHIQMGKWALPVPNIPARVRVARFHDIHHIVTGYPANWLGEAEIGAWEMATGCRTSLIAWSLNAGAAFVGFFMNPRAVLLAFRRGWNTKTNLYHDFDYDSLLNLSIKEVREKIGLAETMDLCQ